MVEQIAKVRQDTERLKKILSEASRQRKTRLADLEVERRRLERELKTLTENLPSKNGSGQGNNQLALGQEAIRENIGHLERRLVESQEQALALQQQPLGAEEAARVLAALDHGFSELPVIEQTRLIRMMVQRVDYDGGQGQLAVTLNPAGLVAALEEHTKQEENSK